MMIRTLLGWAAAAGFIAAWLGFILIFLQIFVRARRAGAAVLPWSLPFGERVRRSNRFFVDHVMHACRTSLGLAGLRLLQAGVTILMASGLAWLVATMADAS